jgi:hypothetical protein
MKLSGKLSCLIAAAVLIVMIAAVITNAIFIKGATDHLLMLIDTSESIYIISQCWEECIPKLKLTLSQKELDDISLNINEAIICAEKQDDEEYKRSMARLRRAIEGIKKREEFSLENVF